jgi:HicA toxin of bacterial toxin-antitoxin,
MLGRFKVRSFAPFSRQQCRSLPIAEVMVHCPARYQPVSPVEREICQLRAELKKAGFVKDPKRGQGSHTYWEHPRLPAHPVVLSGQDGDDAQPYQEKAVREALLKARGK